MDDKKIDYIERLIKGVRKQVKKNYGVFEGQITIPSTWIDASILCDVIEREVLPILKSNDS